MLSSGIYSLFLAPGSGALIVILGDLEKVNPSVLGLIESALLLTSYDIRISCMYYSYYSSILAGW
jgi:hypothetical protein